MTTKRLYRSTHNRVFAGICGGLGEYTNVDAVLIRLIWLLIVIFTGVVPGLVAYFLAIFIIPNHPPASTRGESSPHPHNSHTSHE